MSNSNKVWYFAYGSNMYSEVLTGRRKVKPMKSLPGTAKGYKLTFNLFGFPFIEPSFGNTIKIEDVREKDEKSSLLPKKDGFFTDNIEAEGVLHLITEEDYLTIRRTEGGNENENYGYQDVIIDCVAKENQIIKAHTLITPPLKPLKGEARPSLRYLNLLIEGAKEHNLPLSYQLYLQNLPYFKMETKLQYFAKYLIIVILLPFVLPVLITFLLTNITKFQPPVFISLYMSIINNLTWWLHDTVLAPLFGKGQ